MQKDTTNPQHYKNGEVECIDAIKSAVVAKPAFEAILVGHVIRYLWRYESKGGISDVQKARWYIDRLFDTLLVESTPVVDWRSVDKVSDETRSRQKVSSVDAESLRWIAIDLGSDVLNDVVDRLELFEQLLAESAPHVPPTLSAKIKEATVKKETHDLRQNRF